MKAQQILDEALQVGTVQLGGEMDFSTNGDDDGETVVTGKYEIQKHRHTKRNCDIWIVVLSNRCSTAMFERLRTSCKRVAGWYSRQWGRTPGGFAFDNPTDAKTWAASEFASEASE